MLKLDLEVVWLDLANALESVPHWLIKFAFEFFHIPEKIIRMLDTYCGVFQMWFTTRTYRTSGRTYRLVFTWGAPYHQSYLFFG